MSGFAMPLLACRLSRRGSSGFMLLLLAAFTLIHAVSFCAGFVASGRVPWATAEPVVFSRRTREQVRSVGRTCSAENPVAASSVSGNSSVDELDLAQELKGKVSKLTNYGAEVDLALDKIGWLHVAQVRDGFTDNITDVLELDQQVSVRIKHITPTQVEVTMRDLPMFQKKKLSLFNVGDELKGQVMGFSRAAVFVDVGAMIDGYLSIDNMKGEEVTLNRKNLSASSVKPGDELEVQVLRVTQTQLTLTQKGL